MHVFQGARPVESTSVGRLTWGESNPKIMLFKKVSRAVPGNHELTAVGHGGKVH